MIREGEARAKRRLGASLALPKKPLAELTPKSDDPQPALPAKFSQGEKDALRRLESPKANGDPDHVRQPE